MRPSERVANQEERFLQKNATRSTGVGLQSRKAPKRTDAEGLVRKNMTNHETIQQEENVN